MSKIWRVKWRGTYADGTLIENTLHVVDNPTGIFANDSAGNIADRVHDRLETEYRAMCSSGLTIHELTATEVVPPGSHDVPEQGVHTVEAAGTGAGGDDALPKTICAVLDLKTNAAVRSGHGWIMCPPPLNSTQIVAEHWFAAGSYANAVQAFGNKVATSWDVGTLEPHHYYFAVYSRTRHARGDSQYWFEIISHYMQPTPRYLRSRRTSP